MAQACPGLSHCFFPPWRAPARSNAPEGGMSLNLLCSLFPIPCSLSFGPLVYCFILPPNQIPVENDFHSKFLQNNHGVAPRRSGCAYRLRRRVKPIGSPQRQARNNKALAHRHRNICGNRGR